ncbi:MAG: thioredoxin family protein [Nitrospinae bacterium CG11_big_fil_rev_8_21_14_0_20_56_8]|nr:MAG: thioredoxin family protein [Nitrospinae bacterium CG11_big_fil_rev_8_21_14_0_20_56_8]
MPLPISIEILTRKDCSLCETAKEVIDKVIRDYFVTLKMTDIESSPELLKEFGEKIPVVRIEGETSFVYKVHPTTLRNKLDRIVKSGM